MAEREELILEIRTELDRAKAEVADLESQLTELEDKQIELDVDTGDAQAELTDVKTAATELGLEFTTTEDKIKAVTTTIETLAETLDAELRDGKAAADALGNALGPELSAKVNVDEVVSDLQRMGLTTDEIRANADQLASSFRQVDGIRTQGLADGLDYTNTRMTGLRNNADQSRSVLANLAGNSAQDLGELGGVVGTLGVGLGQLAEYAVDGNIKLSALARVAGPMLGVAAATVLVTKALQESAEVRAFDTDQVEAYGEAVREVRDDVEAVRSVLEEAGKIEFSISDWGIVDVTPLLAAFGANVDDVAEAIAGGAEGLALFRQQLIDAGASAEGADFIMAAIVANMENFEAGAAGADASLSVFSDNLQDFQEKLDSLRDPLTVLPEQWRILINDLRDGELDMAHVEERINNLAEATGLSTDAVIERANQELDQILEDEAEAAGEAAGKFDVFAGSIEKTGLFAKDFGVAWGEAVTAIDKTPDAAKNAAGQLEAITTAADEARDAALALGQELADVAGGLDTAALRASGFTSALGEINRHISELDASGEVITFVEGMRGISGAINDAVSAGVDLEGLDIVPDSWNEVLNMPAELGPVQDAIRTFRTIVQSEFTQAFGQGGSTEAREWAANTRTAIENELRVAGDLTETQIQEIIAALGLLPDDVDITIRIAAEEQARAVIAGMASAIADLPTETQLLINAVAATDPIAALQLAIDAFEDAGVEVPAQLIVLQDQLQADAEAAVAGVEPPTIRVPTEAEIEGARTDLEKVSGADYLATVLASADVETANTDLLDAADEPRSALIVAHARTAGAEIDLAAVADAPRTAVIDVATGTVDVPTASQIAASIGTVRVQIQGVWSSRIEGSRPR